MQEVNQNRLFAIDSVFNGLCITFCHSHTLENEHLLFGFSYTKHFKGYTFEVSLELLLFYLHWVHWCNQCSICSFFLLDYSSSITVHWNALHWFSTSKCHSSCIVFY